MATELAHTVKPSGGDYTTLDAAVDHLVAAHANLVGSDNYATINISGSWSSADTAAVTVNGLTVDATRYLKISCDAANRPTAAARSTSKYMLSVANAIAVIIQDDYVTFDSMQIETSSGNGNDQHVFYIASIAATNNAIKISNCRIKGHGNASYRNSLIYTDDGDILMTIWNCILYNAGTNTNSSGARLNTATTNIYNCVSYGNYSGFRRAAGTANAYDSVAFNTTDDFNGTWAVIDYCASDDNDGTNNVSESGGGASWTNDFTDAANGDFSLKSGSNLIGAGGKAGSGTFSDDIDGTTRGAAWDLGAHEYVAPVTSAGNRVLSIV